MAKESNGSGGCRAGGPLSQCPLTAAAIPLLHITIACYSGLNDIVHLHELCVQCTHRIC